MPARRQGLARAHFGRTIPLVASITLLGLLDLSVQSVWARVITAAGTAVLSTTLIVLFIRHLVRVGGRSARSTDGEPAGARREIRTFVVLFAAGASLWFSLAAFASWLQRTGGFGGAFLVAAVALTAGTLLVETLLVAIRVRSVRARASAPPLVAFVTGAVIVVAEALPAVIGVYGFVDVVDTFGWVLLAPRVGRALSPGLWIELPSLAMLVGSILWITGQVLLRVALVQARELARASAESPPVPEAVVVDDVEGEGDGRDG